MKNDICRLLAIPYPIIQGGMGNISNATLTAAVSNAGGLGTIGAGTMTPDEVEAIILETKEQTSKPFAVNIPINVTPYTDTIIDLVIQHGVSAVSLSAGNPAPYIPTLQVKGIKVLAIVAAVKHAAKAEAAGAEIVVAEGFEAAGINSNLELTTMTLIPQVVNNVSIPVIAAGGIGDGHGLAAALMLGAQGVQMGTRFIATQEAPFHDQYKEAIVQAEDTTTRILGRSVGQSRRVLTNDYAEKIRRMEQEGLSPQAYANLTTEEQHIRGAIDGDFTEGFINGGQVSGLIENLPTVESLIQQMVEEAKTQVTSVRDMLEL